MKLWHLYFVAIRILQVAAEDALVEWLTKNGGTFSEKIHFAPLDPTDKFSSNGIFANRKIAENETIMIIPQKCLFTTPAPQSICETARALADHRRQGDKSFFKEYVDYMFNGENSRKIPDRWSGEAVDIMNDILGDELSRPMFHDRTFQFDCGGTGSKIEEDAYEFVISRSWNEVMIPVYDMVNHKNGKYRNVEASSAHLGKDVKVYAYKDIEAGGQLFLSYNECKDTDCEGLFPFYGTQEILGDYGFVEQFPQRWIFDNFPAYRDTNEPLVFDIDHVNKEDPYEPSTISLQYEVTWHTATRPNLMMTNAMLGQVDRLNALEKTIMNATASLESNHERSVIETYYSALKFAIKLAVWSYYDQSIDKLGVLAGNDEDHYYDTLSERPVIGNLGGSFVGVCHPKHEQFAPHYETFYEVNSQYQHIEYRYGEEEDDTCMWLSGWGQTCSSFRQYHEALVHYPASFLPEIKRVVYIGGGDNMILHEILKYDSIELVMGLELDQQVVRYSFMNLGTLPYFDDPRVQWWFGDATKSLQMLPEDFYGSFDLVLVDLQTFVADALFVTDKLSIMDTMKLLMNETHGIISKNEDFPNRKLTKFARYTVDMEYCDLPQICRQSISIGSNSVNFLTAPQYQHDIHRLYMNASLEASGKFNNWYDYRDNGKISDKSYPASDQIVQDPSALTSSKAVSGLLVVLEAEMLHSDVGRDFLKETIMKTLHSNGFEPLLGIDERTDGKSTFDISFIFNEGYIVVRKRSQATNYLAMDLILWDGLSKVNSLKTNILSDIGADENASSSYRLVVGGIEGGTQQSYLEAYSQQPGSKHHADKEIDHTTERSESFSELKPLMSLCDRDVVVVLCGEITDDCTSYHALKELYEEVLPFYTCSDLNVTKHDSFLPCEARMIKKIKQFSSRSISHIVLDNSSARITAQIFLRLVTRATNRAQAILQEASYVVLAELKNEKWREVFVERFRTEVSPFAPSKEAILRLGGGNTFSLFASGNSGFYKKLVEYVSNSDHEVVVDSVMSGDAKYVPDFDPPFFNNADFDNTRAYNQWRNQKPIGFQVYLQMGLQPPKTPLREGETVLWQHDDNIWLGKWAPVTVVTLNEDLTYDVLSEEFGYRWHVSRDSLRRMDFDHTSSPMPIIDVGARVLIHRGENDWGQGFIVSRSDDNQTYEVRDFDENGAIVEMKVEEIMPQYETTHDAQLSKLSMTKLEKVLSKCLDKFVDNFESSEYPVLKGGVITSFWKGGNLILVWDGARRVDVNLYLDVEDEEMAYTLESEFLARIPFLSRIAMDEQPRGFSSVVNFASELHDETPIWWDNEDENEDFDENENNEEDTDIPPTFSEQEL